MMPDPQMLESGGHTKCQAIILRGPPGVGKSCLLRHLSKIHPNVLYSSGDSVEKSTQLFVWRNIMSHIIHDTNRIKHNNVHGNTASSGFIVLGRRKSGLMADPSGLGKAVEIHQRSIYTDPNDPPPPSSLCESASMSALKQRARKSQMTNHHDEMGVTSEQHIEQCSSGHGSNTGSDMVSNDDYEEEDSECHDARMETNHLLQTHQPSASVSQSSSSSLQRTHQDRSSPSSGLAFINAIVQSGAIAAESLPLLNVFMPHCFPENSHSLALATNPELFSKELEHLVLAVLRQVTLTQPILLAWDDGQWIDSASWDFLSKAIALSSNITCVVVYRQDSPPIHAEFKKFEGLSVVLRCDLHNLSLRDTSLFLSHRYGIAIMNAELLEFVYRRAHGNPSDTIALMQRLLELEKIQIDLERGIVNVLKDFDELDMEISVQTRAKVTYHYDNLNTMTQLALRIVSASFEFIHFDTLDYILRTVFAIEYDTSFTHGMSHAQDEFMPAPEKVSQKTMLPKTMTDLAHVDAHGIITIDRTLETIRFTSEDMRLVVYNVMLPSQREMIHRVFSFWFENEVPHHRMPWFQHCHHLAYHFSRTRMYGPAMDYFAKGAEEALLRGVSDFALTCLTSASAVLPLMESSVAHDSSRSDDSHNLPPPPSHKRHHQASVCNTHHVARSATAPSPSRSDSKSKITAAAAAASAADDMLTDVALHQCKIEFLTGLVMVQKCEWVSAVNHFRTLVTIYQDLEMQKGGRGIIEPAWRRMRRRYLGWWHSLPEKVKQTHGLKKQWKHVRRCFKCSSPVAPHAPPSPTRPMTLTRARYTTLADEVESFVRVAKKLTAKIVTVERERVKTSNLIRLQGLRSISSIQDSARLGVNMEEAIDSFMESPSPSPKHKQSPPHHYRHKKTWSSKRSRAAKQKRAHARDPQLTTARENRNSSNGDEEDPAESTSGVTLAKSKSAVGISELSRRLGAYRDAAVLLPPLTHKQLTPSFSLSKILGSGVHHTVIKSASNSFLRPKHATTTMTKI
jgi:hypothetical protein